MRILITAGPTREFFDTVRFISNPSSGRMGFALAHAARRRGHQVVLIAGPVDLQPPGGVETISVVSAEQMFRASLKAFTNCDAAIMTAAVCDYRPASVLAHKLKKRAAPRIVKLLPTRDIAAHLGGIKRDRVIVGFAMEDQNARRHAETKRRKKNCDAMVLNGFANIGSTRATVEILRADGRWSKPVSGTKLQIANRVVKLVEELSTRARLTNRGA